MDIRDPRIGLRRYERSHAEGDPFALDECILYCDKRSIELPKWVMDVIVKRSQDYISGNTKRKIGRHANPKTAKRDRDNKIQSLAAVIAVRRVGIKGLDVYEKAAEIMAVKKRVNRSPEAVKNDYYKMKKIIKSPPYSDVLKYHLYLLERVAFN